MERGFGQRFDKYVSHDYGLAIETTEKPIPGLSLKGYTGGAYGLSSMMFFQPRKKLGIVAITNGCNVINCSGFNPPLKAIVNILYEEVIE